MLYKNVPIEALGHERSKGRILIDGGLYTPIREDGIIIGGEPTPLLLSLFDAPPQEDELFGLLVEFALHHDWGTPEITGICDRLLALGMRKGESLTLYKAVRRGMSVP